MQCSDLLLRIADEHQSSSLKLRRLYDSKRGSNDSTRALDKRLSCKGALKRILKTCANDPVVARQLHSSVRSLNASESKNDPAKSLYQFAFEEVGHYWKELGASLGFRMAELNGIEEHHLNRRLGAKFMAWAMLEKYRAANGHKLSSIERLHTKLREVERLRKSGIPREDKGKPVDDSDLIRTVTWPNLEDDRAFLLVASCIAQAGRDKWRTVGFYLGMHREVKDSKFIYLSDDKERMLMLLHEWRDKEGQKALASMIRQACDGAEILHDVERLLLKKQSDQQST